MGISKADGIYPQSTKTRTSRNFVAKATGLEKKLNLELSRLLAKYPQADLELWSEDEHHLGLQPILRRVWTPIAEQLLRLKLNINGSGFMDLSIQNQEKIRRGFYLVPILKYLTKFWLILPENFNLIKIKEYCWY